MPGSTQLATAIDRAEYKMATVRLWRPTVNSPRFITLLVAITLVASGCQTAEPVTATEQSTLGSRLTFLTRGACANTPAMRASLDEALINSGYAADYPVIDTGTLIPTDPRCGYGTPTILFDGRDLFDAAAPKRGVRHVPM